MRVTIEGNREILGLSIGDSEDKVSWTEFLKSLRARGLVGVEQHDECIAAERRYLSEQSMAQLTSTTTEIDQEIGPPTFMA